MQKRKDKAPAGATLIKNKPGIEVNSMFSQEAQVLLFKTHFLVVNLLVVNVSHYLRQVGSAYSESSVTFLPCEAFSMVIHPSRRVSLAGASHSPGAGWAAG